MLSSKIQQKIAKQKATVSKEEIKKYYEQHKSQYGTPEKRDVRIVLTKTEAQANEAKKEIESGKSFASVAKSKSIDPTSKNTGGELKGVVKGQEEKALDEAIFSAPQGRARRSREDAVRLLHLRSQASTTPGSSQSLAQSEAAIKQQLAATGQQSALSKFVKEFRSKWEAKTECASGYSVQDCHGVQKTQDLDADANGTRPAPRGRPRSNSLAGAAVMPA